MDPFKNVNQWKNHLDSFFGDTFLQNFENLFHHNHFPHINIYETENELLCLASLPGLDNINSVDVFIENQSIELKGKINLTYKGFRLSKDEIFNGHFERKIELPFQVKEDKVAASYQNGLLIIHLHRLIPSEQARTKVQVKHIE